MGFFDLNIPYLESNKLTTVKSTAKTTRLKLIIKSMELGYTGVAYNRTIKGLMSESDCCSISLFPLSSLLKLSPSLSTSVKLHRDVLGIPFSTAFRQYTRLTVVVDSSSQALALNSGNPILKSYDIVAVQPMNQNAFEQACQASEVDLIAIDFSEKLPFRLKQSMVKAAIGRGVSFEIPYSTLIKDAQVRRQMISNVKLLVDWTRGKNLIFSSAAPSVTEIRGPYDVANLSSLLGLPMECAKAAISKNCRSLIANALTKKQFYKEAIRVEAMPSSDLKGPWFDDWLKWDPISSGEGDLLLDDMAQSFSASSKASKTVKAIDFASVIDSLPSHGLQIKDLTSVAKAASEPPGISKNLSSAVETIVPVTVYGVSELPDRPNLLPEDQTSLSDAPTKHQASKYEDSKMSFSPTDTKVFTNAEEFGSHTTRTEEKPKISNGLDVYFVRPETEVQDLQSQSCVTIRETNVMLPDDNAKFHTLVEDTEIDSARNAAATAEISTPSKNKVTSAFQSEECKRSNSLDVTLGEQDVVMDEVVIETDIKRNLDFSLVSRDASLDEGFPVTEQFRGTGDDSVTLANGLPILESCDVMKNKKDYSVADHLPLEELAMEEQKQIEDKSGMNYPTSEEYLSGKGRVKQGASNRASLFPFKRLWNPVPFKKKARKFKNKNLTR